MDCSFAVAAMNLSGIVNGIDYDEYNPEADPEDCLYIMMPMNFRKRES